MFEREDRRDPEVIDRDGYGLGWLAAPEEGARRASHAVYGEDGVYLFDPLDSDGVDEIIGSMEDEVEGVAVLSTYHTRDADVFADRYDVPVYLPEDFDRVEERLESEVREVGDGEELGNSGFEVWSFDPVESFQDVLPVSRWRESIAYRESDGTLYTPDLMSEMASAGEEELGVYLMCRVFPPDHHFEELEPERILSGHGEGVFEDADQELEESLEKARARLPKALIENGYERAKTFWGAVRE
ncbi:MAG: hypothetical protein ABEK01_03215 [Candidatus Nanohaloarchaea archaeon]